ncbi:MAG: hypothetical protein JNK14_11480 [Chitinophagaceae bacterium]|nr:hypothetical protein [Chitinophagaceae bacterium]
MRLYTFLYPALLAVAAIMIIQSCKKDDVIADDDDDTTNTADNGFVTNTKDTTFINAVVIKYTDTSVTVTILSSAAV